MRVPQAYIDRWRGEVPVFVIGIVLLIVCAALLGSKNIYASWSTVSSSAWIYATWIIGIVCVDAGWQLVKFRPDSPIAHLKQRYLHIFIPAYAIAALPLFGLLFLVLPFFSMMKSAIPLFNDYTWDDTFIEWDRAIFFGYDAWEVMQPVLGYPLVTAIVALLYHLWLLLLYPGCFYFLTAKIDERLRRQFFLSYILSWSLVGGAMATWLASVGPCFVGPMLSDDRFDDQMAYLNAANEQYPIMVLPVQQMLLDWYDASSNGLGSGITAMPSMHVAIAFLFWLAMRKISRKAGLFFGAFFIITWIGSVHTAYHYAVDGLVSVVAIVPIWWVSGQIIDAWDRMISNQAALRTKTVPAE